METSNQLQLRSDGPGDPCYGCARSWLVVALIAISGCSQPAQNGSAGASPSRKAQTKVERQDAKKAPKSKTTDSIVVNSIGMKLKLIPAGEFLMGSPASDPRSLDSERPQRKVRISQPFWMGVFEVTQEQYAAITKERPSWFAKTGEGKALVKGLDTRNFPVEFVGWEDAQYFCKQLSETAEEKAAGRSYRLPSEAEWEYACRAGSRARFFFGDDKSKASKYGWVDQPPKTGRTHNVGKKLPNAFGLHDMTGNVYEWCHDYYQWDYYRKGSKKDPAGPKRGKLHVMRGGSINYGQLDDCRSGARSSDAPPRDGYPHCHIGFRVVCEIR